MTTPDEAASLVSRLLDSFNTRQFDRAADLYTPDYITRPFGTSAADGLLAWQAVVAKFPDISLVAEDILVTGDMVTVRSAVVGTEVLVFGAPPVLIEVFRVRGGRFAEWWGSTWLPDLG